MCIVARCTVSRHSFIIVRRWLTSDRLSRTDYYSTIVRTYSDLSRGTWKSRNVWACRKDRVIRNRSCSRYKNAPTWLHKSLSFYTFLIDTWQIFYTHRLIDCVAIIDVKLVVGILNTTLNLIIREKKLTQDVLVYCAFCLYLYGNILQFAIFIRNKLCWIN